MAYRILALGERSNGKTGGVERALQSFRFYTVSPSPERFSISRRLPLCKTHAKINNSGFRVFVAIRNIFAQTPPIVTDHTEFQSDEERRRAQELSLQRTGPPTEVPGYDLRRFLGSGAYGEVWAGVDRNTGRQVAVKFYLHRGGLDWSLLSREVEKLVYLSADRYIVQLLEVGWDADPPYYVMEFIENGSLENLLDRDGILSVADAVEMFEELAVGLVHAHGKGVLHCDLKPANILLDQDNKPRLADFGQSRLSSDQTPALGTLFYMAPEQADLEAVPDARWDVYALGAILYCMLVGDPPHRDPHALGVMDTANGLTDRLTRYRDLLRASPPPTGHLKAPGMDSQLAEIITRCLAVKPQRRFANVQEVLDALRLRRLSRTRRPLMLLGIVGPLLLLAVMSFFGWRGYVGAMNQSEAAVVAKVRNGNRFAAQAVAAAAAAEIERYFRTVEHLAANPEFQADLAATTADPELEALLVQLTDPQDNSTEPFPPRDRFQSHPSRADLQRWMDDRLAATPSSASWFVCDTVGTQLASSFRAPTSRSTIGRNYSYRTYFHGGPRDLSRTVDGRTEFTRPAARLTDTHLSAPFQSKATNKWKMAVSAPVFHRQKFVGVVAMTVDLGVFVHLESHRGGLQHAVLVDGRKGQRGMILQHPLFDEVLKTRKKLPDRFAQYRIPASFLDSPPAGQTDPSDIGATNEDAVYNDPLGGDMEGAAYRRPWIAAPALVRRNGGKTGLIVLVQEDYAEAVRPIQSLGRRLVFEGSIALVVVLGVIVALWYCVFRWMAEPRRHRRRSRRDVGSESAIPLPQRTTLAAPGRRETKRKS